MPEIQHPAIRRAVHAQHLRDAVAFSLWFLLQTKPCQEHRAHYNLLEQGVGAFLPILPSKRCTGEHHPLFPGYIFGFFPEDFVATANSTFGVLRVPRFGDSLAVVSPEVIEEIALRLDDNGVLIGTQPGAAGPHVFHRGDQVRVTAGPLAGLVAVFDAGVPGKDRAQILLNTVAHYAGGWTCSRQAPEMRGAAIRATVDVGSLALA